MSEPRYWLASDEARYLTGRMTEDEREKFAERLLTDDALYDELRATEAELLDAYARNELTSAERVEVERRLLQTDDQRRRLLFSMAIASRSPKRSFRAGVWLAIAAIVLSSAIGLNFFLRHRTPPAPPQEVAILRLPAGVTRSESTMPEFAMPAAALVELRIPMQPVFARKSLQASLYNKAAAQVWTGPLTPLENPADGLAARVETKNLTDSPFELAVRTVETGEVLAYFYFRLK